MPPAQAFCRDLLAWQPARWTALTVEGVEPTHNAAERALRPAVLWHPSPQSEAGNLFVTRLLTVIMTCRPHKRPVLTFLTEAVRAHIAGLPAPDLFSPTP